ncbi:MAG: DUF1320 family protein [Pseudomonas sp.]|nr:DUF1320 family protein [Pseudomonas sp.]
MAFLIKTELGTVATMSVIDKLTGPDYALIEDIIDESISLMTGYLSRYYDTSAIFAAEGHERHKTVLKRLKDIVIYEIYERHTREQNAVAARRYNEAMKWLEELNSGEMADKTLPPIPPTTEPEGTTGETRFGGNKQYTSIY